MATYYRALKSRIIVVTVLVALIPLPLVTGSFIKYYKTYIRGAVVKELATLASNRKEAIEIFLRERITLLRALAYSHSQNTLIAPSELARIHAVLRSQAAGLVDLGVIDSQGRHVAYTGPYDLLGRNYSQTTWFREAVEKGIYVSDTFLGYRQVPHMVIAVKREEGHGYWILRATVDAATFHQLVRSAQIGRGGDAFVINRAWDFQVPPRFPERTLREERLLHTKLTTSTVTQLDVGNKKIFQATTWLNNGRWLLVVREDSSAEFFSLESAKRIAVAAFVLGVLVISATVVLLTNKLVSQLQRHEAEKEMLSEQLAQTSKLASLGKFAAGVAHEINNPLAIINESAGWMKELLDMNKPAAEERQELSSCIDDVKSEVRRCKEITQRLLGFARTYESRLGPTDVNAVLKEVIEFLYKAAMVRNISLQHHLQNGLPPIVSDISQLQQVFLNILDNALYAVSEKKGHGNIMVTSHKEADGVRVTISDDGLGVPPEARDKLFDPFFTTKPVGKGTGLGLSICYGIVTKLGGRLWAEHPPAGGTIFHIHLPAEPKSKGGNGA
ncbi:MAG: ATP-binding protein [Pseudomonadota bacterium]